VLFWGGRGSDKGCTPGSCGRFAAGEIGEAVELAGGAADFRSRTRSKDGPVAGEVVVGEVSVVAGSAGGAVDFEASPDVGGVFSLGGGNFCSGLTSTFMRPLSDCSAVRIILSAG
jgi:hypothetical protein